jgi:hypothetical protein
MDTYLRIYPPDGSEGIILISNNGDCLEAALAAVKNHPQVEGVQVDDQMVSDYTLPDDDIAASEEPTHQLFKYRVMAVSGTDGRLVSDLESRIRQAVSGHSCEVTVMRD